jgi:hypothetical protein
MLSSKTPRSRVRLYAAAWTAAVAAVPAYIAAGTGTFAGEWIVPERLPLTLLAILAAGISGYWIGWRLIDPNGRHDSLGALFLGAVACLLSYYLLGLMVAVLGIVPKIAANIAATPQGPLINLLAYLLLGLGAVFVNVPLLALYFGIQFTGWYTLPVACIAGFLLSFRYRRR